VAAAPPRLTPARRAPWCDADVPFRIKVSLWILALFAGLVLVGPLLVPVPALSGVRPARELAWPGSAWVDVGGLQVHVEAMADGVPLLAPGDADAAAVGAPFLLLHGFGANTRSWGSTLPWLSQGGVAVAYDRPAFGLTDRPLRGWPRDANPYGPAAQVATAVGVLDALGIERAVLVGHSAGGSIALQTALAHPERVAGLVLVGAAVYAGGGAPAWARPLLRTPQFERIGPLLMRQLGGQQGDEFLRSAWADPSRLDAATVEAYRRALQVEDWDRALWELVKASREPDLVPYLAGVRVPVLVVTGAEDRIVPAAQSRDLARDLGGDAVAFVELPGCGHLPHEECPVEFRAVVEDWLGAHAGF
jgi:pimeloyl-ACP methyl ester carboxylesterase